VRAAPAALAALLVVVAGCGSSGPQADARDLPRLVLQPRDLPPAFIRFAAGKQVTADATGDSRADPARFGRKGGWIARYRLPGGDRAQTGPQIVESRTDVFDGGGGADSDLDAYRSDLGELAGSTGSRALEAPDLGDEAFAVTRAQGTGRFRIRLYTFVWRKANVSAALSATGFDRRFTAEQALALARAQERRIETVLGS
jgi:hypothetical protein